MDAGDVPLRGQEWRWNFNPERSGKPSQTSQHRGGPGSGPTNL